MLKKLVCWLWGHLPWRTIAETRVSPSPSGAARHKGTFTDEMYMILMKYNQRMHQGAHVVTVACDRCGAIRTFEH